MSRNENVDILKGIGIFAVVLGHYRVPDMFEQLIFSFHMPLFFILSGYFYKLKDTVMVVKQGWGKLIIPYLFVGIVTVVLSGAKSLLHNEGLDGFVVGIEAALWGSGSSYSNALFSNLPVIGAVWFLLALFFCKVTYNYVDSKCGKQSYVVVLSLSIISTVVCQYVYFPWSILQGVSAMFFYFLGKTFRSYEEKVPSGAYWIIFYAIVWFVSALSFKMSMVRCFYECYPINVLGAICAFLFLYYCVSPFVRKNELMSRLFSYMGRYSLLILCFHLIEQNNFPYVKLVGCLFGEVSDVVDFCIVLFMKFALIMSMVYISTRMTITRKIFSLN